MFRRSNDPDFPALDKRGRVNGARFHSSTDGSEERRQDPAAAGRPSRRRPATGEPSAKRQTAAKVGRRAKATAKVGAKATVTVGNLAGEWFNSGRR